MDQRSNSFNLMNCHALFPFIIPGNWCLWWHSQCSWLTVWTMTSSLPTSLLITLIPQRLHSPMHFSQWMCAVLGMFHILNVINDVALMLLPLTINMIHHNTNCLLLTCVLGFVTMFWSSSSLSYQGSFGSTGSSSLSTTSVATGRSDRFTPTP